MEKYYLIQLPEDVSNLVKKIEQKSGVEIKVKVCPSRACKGTLACKVAKGKAQILIPSEDYFPESSVLHELLHIQRFHLYGVPIIIGADMNYLNGELIKVLAEIDNDLEHLIIVPEELKRRPKRKDYWVEKIQCALDKINSDNYKDKRDMIYLTLKNWIFIKHVLKDDELILTTRKLLEFFKLNDRASQLHDAIVLSLHSKEKIVKIMFNHFNKPAKCASFQYNDGRREPLIEAFKKLP